MFETWDIELIAKQISRQEEDDKNLTSANINGRSMMAAHYRRWGIIHGSRGWRLMGLSFDTTIIQQFKTRNFLELQVDRLVPYDRKCSSTVSFALVLTSARTGAYYFLYSSLLL